MCLLSQCFDVLTSRLIIKKEKNKKVTIAFVMCLILEHIWQQYFVVHMNKASVVVFYISQCYS